MGHRHLLLTAAVALLPICAAAQTIELDEVTLSANLAPIDTSRTGATVSIFTEDDLEEAGEERVIEFLSRATGFSPITRGPIGGVSGFTLRGVSQNYVQVLIDGIPVGDPSATQNFYDFGALTTAQVSRIEVLRGGQSALYGSEAIGGVISITTVDPDMIGTRQSASVELGSYRTARGAYTYSQGDETRRLGFGISAITTQGFSAADENDGNTEPDGFDGQRLSLSYEQDFGAITAGLTAFVQHAAGEFDEQFPIGDGTAGGETFDNVTIAGRAFLRFPTGPVESEIFVTAYDIDRTTDEANAFGLTKTDYFGKRQVIGYIGRLDLAAASLTFGAEAARESYEENADFGGFLVVSEGDKEVFSLYGEYATALSDDLDLAASARFDDDSQFGGQFSGRLATAYRLRDDIVLRASVASGYRSPSLYEQFSASGNTDLEPEESRGVDVGLEKLYANGGVARATAFYSEITNIIDFQGGVYAQADGTARRRGIEIEGEFPLGDRLTASGSYTYTEAETPEIDPSVSLNALFPRHDLALAFSADLTERLRGRFDVQYAADRADLPDYTVVDASLTYAVNPSTEAYLRVENLFDEEYQLRENYGTSDRAIYVGLRASF